VFILISTHEFTKSEEELETMWDKWLYLLRNKNKFERYPQKIQEKILMKFLEQSELAQLSEAERYRYEHSLKVYWVEHAIQKTREKRDLEIAKFEEEYSQFLENYDQLISDYDNMKSNFNLMKSDFNHMKSDYEDLKSHIQHMKSDYDDIRSEMNQLKEASQHEKQTLLSQIIQNGFKDGMSIASLSKLTGLSEEEVLTYL
jgi:chromosome segregation ATPase